MPTRRAAPGAAPAPMRSALADGPAEQAGDDQQAAGDRQHAAEDDDREHADERDDERDRHAAGNRGGRIGAAPPRRPVSSAAR